MTHRILATLLPAALLAAAVAEQPEATRRFNLVEANGLKISTDKPTYQHGDRVKVTVEVPKEGHLRVYGVNYDNSTTILFPNPKQTDDRVSPGTFTLPPEGLEIYVQLEKGQSEITERIHAVFSPEPFADSAPGAVTFQNGAYAEIGVTTSGERATRGLVPTARAKALSAELKVEIKK